MKTVVLSGIDADFSGTGRLLRFLIKETRHRHDIVFLFPPFRVRRLARLLLRTQLSQFLQELSRELREARRWATTLPEFFDPANRLILFHPQTLGYFKAIWFLRLFRGHLSWFLLDSSFFCVKSYNHLDREHEPCLRCLAQSRSRAPEFHCRPFPKSDWYALPFFQNIRRLVVDRNLTLFAQNERQKDLALRHFGSDQDVRVVGLWTDDLEMITIPEDGQSAPPDFDVVFHGNDLPAKGAWWARRLAEYCPNLKFLFPFAKRPGELVTSANCFFLNMTWEHGLEDHVRRAQCVLVPSLWSAPVEGAVVKSVILAQRTAMVENPTCFGDEVPSGLITTLSTKPAQAALELQALLAQPPVSAREKHIWFDDFRKNRESVLSTVAHHVVPRAHPTNCNARSIES